MGKGSTHEARLVRVGELLATGQCKTMKAAMMQAGLSLDTSRNPAANGYDASAAIQAYEKKKLGKKGLARAIDTAKELVVEAIEGDKLDYPSKLKLSGWLVEHDLQRQKALGQEEATKVEPRDIVRFRLAFMRALQKGIALAVDRPDRALAISDRLGDKMMELAAMLREDS